MVTTPYRLLILTKDPYTGHDIDLDEPGWATKNASLMREPATWYLVREADRSIPLSIVVHPGEQPYYTARVFASTTNPEQIRAYGIGKKRLDGHVDRLWILPNGQICGGDDVDYFAEQLLKEG